MTLRGNESEGEELIRGQEPVSSQEGLGLFVRRLGGSAAYFEAVESEAAEAVPGFLRKLETRRKLGSSATGSQLLPTVNEA